MNEKYNPSLAFYHPNPKGTGSAIKFELKPAQADSEGAIMVTGVNQLTIGDMRGRTPIYPRFNWDDRIVVKLGFSDLSKILQVLRGEYEALNDGQGICHTSMGCNTRINLMHTTDIDSEYVFEMDRCWNQKDEERSFRIAFRAHEAVGVEAAITGAMVFVSFGIPKEDICNYA